MNRKKTKLHENVLSKRQTTSVYIIPHWLLSCSLVPSCATLNGEPFFLHEICRGSQAQSKNQLLVLRCLANMFSVDNGQRLMDGQRKWVRHTICTSAVLVFNNGSLSNNYSAKYRGNRGWALNIKVVLHIVMYCSCCWPTRYCHRWSHFWVSVLKLTKWRSLLSFWSKTHH